MKEITKAIEEISEEIASQLTGNIQEGIYSEIESSHYQRTQEFINSVIQPSVKINGNEISVTVGMDYNMMKSTFDKERLYNSHMSVDGSTNWANTGVDVPEGLLTGFDVGTKNSTYHNIAGTNYWYDVFGDRAGENPDYKKLEELIDKTINKYLKKFGIVI